VSALCVTVLLMRRSILTEKLSRRGQHIAREYSVGLYEMLRVADAMDRRIPFLPRQCRSRNSRGTSRKTIRRWRIDTPACSSMKTADSLVS
jgi:hypothetical protein